MNKPLVSVFLPYYNDREFLRESIEAVLNNSYQNIELILLNHASTDDCRKIAHSYHDPRIKHIDMEINYGAGGGLLFEKMLQKATGKYIKPLCADDVLRKDGIEILVNYMENNPNIDFAFGDIEYIDKNSEDLNDSWFKARPHFSIHNDEIKLIELFYRGYSTLPYVGSIVKRECLNKIKLNKTYIMMFDMSVWFKLLCKGYKVGYVNKIVVNYRIHDSQMSGTKQKRLPYHRSWFETASFWEIIFEIENVEFAKKLFPNNKYRNKLKNKKDIPFYIATSLFYVREPYPFIVLDKMIHDEQYAKHLYETFGFGPKELRDLYAYLPEIDESDSKKKKFSLKKHIYSKYSKNLSILQLLFLIFRRIFYGIEPIHNYRKIKKKLTKRKARAREYSV